MEDSIQAVLGGAKIIGELGDRQLELDLSLAGVSDNTARHRKAISGITEQQKRTTSTLDAVVRAVKRLARSRSRSRGPGEHSAGQFDQAARGEILSDGEGRWGSMGSAAVPQQAYVPPAMQEPKTWQDGPAGGLGERESEDEAGRPEEWLGNNLDESQPRLLEGPMEDDAWGGLVEELTGRYG